MTDQHNASWQIAYCFPTAIAQSFNVLSSDDVANALEACHDMRNKHRLQETQWLSGANSPWNTFGSSMIFDEVRLQPVLTALLDAATLFLKAHDDNTTLTCDDAWINIYGRGNYQEPHAHAYPSLVTAVYYLQADETCGRIVFQSPNQQTLIEANFVNQNSLTDTVRWYQPMTNMALVCKSNLVHYVLPNTTDAERISIVANFRAK